MNDWRARLGFLIPAVTPTVEIEMIELAPRGVSCHFSRMVARGPVGRLDNLLARAQSHIDHMDLTVELLAAVKPNVIVLAHTATSYVLGKEGEARLGRELEKKTGIPFISALGSVVKAFGVLGVNKIAVGTAYDDALTQRSRQELESYGLQVLNAQCIPDVKSIFEQTPKQVYGLVKDADRAEAEGLFISGVGLPTLDVLQALEDDLRKPVISSASAMMWNALRTAGVGAQVKGYGRLLAEY